MSKNTNIFLLSVAALFAIFGVMSAYHATPYAELTNIETINGTIHKLHCPNKGAAALSLKESDFTYNLTVKFKREYCEDDRSQILLGKTVEINALKMNDEYYQTYQLTGNGQNIVSPADVEADQSSSTFGLFLLAFLLVALVIYKNKTAKPKQ
ncbi:hypothetical protein [Thalassotalea sp. G2M2-11]|uniref:hypothetical protein n=1 Tax=Thalassotalea sp. G2M2-11 TaxID=2787627 RepID=UPI0019D20EBC|nr:hypothetical protein [Thalassotalea sp. G2M2-11]